MKKNIFGSIFCMSGIILYGMYLISASIYSGYGGFKTKEFGQEMVGSFPLILAVILFIMGIVISIIGFSEREK